MVVWSAVTCLRFVLYLCVCGMVHSSMFKVCAVFVRMVAWSTVPCLRFVLCLCVWWHGPQLHVQGLCCVCAYGNMVHSYMFKVCVAVSYTHLTLPTKVNV